MTADENELMQRLTKVADEQFDGHLSILKFTTNWRVSFRTPSDRDDINEMSDGKTFAEAAQKALDQAASKGQRG